VTKDQEFVSLPPTEGIKMTMRQITPDLLSLQYALLVVTTGVSLAIAQDRVNSTTFNVILMSMSVTCFMLLIWTKYSYCTTGHQHSLIQPNTWLIGTILFGFGSITWHVINTILSFHLDGSYRSIFYSGLPCVFVGFEILFIIKHSDVIFTSSVISKFFVVHIFSTNICRYFDLIANVLAERKQHMPLVCNKMITEMNCINQSAMNGSEFNSLTTNTTSEFSEEIISRFEKFISLPYICVLEFHIIAGGFLLKKWLETHEMTRRKVGGETGVIYELLTTRHWRVSYVWLRRLFFSMTCSIALLTLFVHGVWQSPEKKSLDTSLRLQTWYKFFHLGTICIATVYSSLGIIKLSVLFESRELKQLSRNNYKEMVSEITLLIISLGSVFTYQGLGFMATLIGKTNIFAIAFKDFFDFYCKVNFEDSVGFLLVLLGLLQTTFIMSTLALKTTVQTKLISNTQPGSEKNNQAGRHFLPSLCIAVSSSIFLCNIALGLARILDQSHLYYNHIFYGFKNCWPHFSFVVNSFLIFFHFHSAALCIDILF
jgi:hypothetical protein